MSSQWPTVRLGDLALKITKGTTPKSFVPDNFPGRVNFVKVETIGQDGRIVVGKFSSIDAETHSALTRSILEVDDLLFTIAGTIGRVARVREHHLPANTNQAVAIIRANKRLVDIGYLFFALSDQVQLQQAQSRVVQSVQANFSLKELAELMIPLPPLDEQRRIAEVLGALDDLIEVDERLAHLNSELAETLWLSAVSDSSNEIRLEECASLILGGTPSRKEPAYWGGEIPWLNSGKANEFRVVEPSERITAEGLVKSSTKMMPVGATIIAITGATLGQVSRTEIPACGNQSLVGVWSEDGAVNDFLFFGVQSRIHILLRSATGGAQQHVNKANVGELTVPWIPRSDIHSWHQVAGPLMQATAGLLFEAKVLREAREALLPLLVSGRVRVGEVVPA